MEPYTSLILACAIGYLMGSIPFGLLLTRYLGKTKQDIRSIGSGNIGATNVLRTGNKLLAALTLILDMSKGAIALALVFYSGLLHKFSSFNGAKTISFSSLDNALPSSTPNLNLDNYSLFLIIGICAILGHCFPIWLKFKGGKGVATTIGVIWASIPLAGLFCCLSWLITAFITKISSLAALLALSISSAVTFIVYGAMPGMIMVVITLFIGWRHQENIKRLLKGTESKITLSSK